MSSKTKQVINGRYQSVKLIKCLVWFILMGSVASCSMKSVDLLHKSDSNLSKTCRHAFFDWRAASHMVDYYNHKCVERAREQGYVPDADSDLANKDFSIPPAPQGGKWTEALALRELDAGRITEEKYGYIIGMLEMTYRATVNKAEKDLEDGKITSEEFERIKQQANDDFYGTSGNH